MGIRAQYLHQCLGTRLLSTRTYANAFLRAPLGGGFEGRHAIDRYKEETQHRPKDGEDFVLVGSL